MRGCEVCPHHRSMIRLSVRAVCDKGRVRVVDWGARLCVWRYAMAPNIGSRGVIVACMGAMRDTYT